MAEIYLIAVFVRIPDDTNSHVKTNVGLRKLA